MEHLKNIAAGLFGLSVVAIAVFGLLGIGLFALDAGDWILRHRPERFVPLLYAAGTLGVLSFAWAIGRSMRNKPANAGIKACHEVTSP